MTSATPSRYRRRAPPGRPNSLPFYELSHQGSSGRSQPLLVRAPMSKTRGMSDSSSSRPTGPKRGVGVGAHRLGHAYRRPEGSISVLEDIDLDIAAGDYVALSGPSGAGKSTLLSLLGGLERPVTGHISVGDVNVTGLAGDGLAAYRRKTVGFVFQHFGLLETLSASENVEIACTLAGLSRARRRQRARDLLDAVDLKGRATHRPGALSGGERQRVAIARALANRPRLVLADEPTGNLDEGSALRVIELLETLQRRWGYTVIVATHNRSVAARARSRLALDTGRLKAL
jgi:ABC-type lipoprotein export system ATPase subunit